MIGVSFVQVPTSDTFRASNLFLQSSYGNILRHMRESYEGITVKKQLEELPDKARVFSALHTT